MMKDIKVTLGDIPSFGATLKGVTVNQVNGATSHDKLAGRDLPGQHPASAISGISEAIENALGEAKASGLFDGKDGVDGKDGYTPVKGVDYFDGKDGKDGINGKDGADGKDGHTPVKGVDYFDGKNGIDGKTPIKGVDYFDGKDGADGKDGKDGTTGKTAYEYAQDGGYAGTEADFAKKLAAEPLIGTTAEITPTQVAEAITEGRPVAIEFYMEAFNGSMTVNHFSTDLSNQIMSVLNMGQASFIFTGSLEHNSWDVQIYMSPTTLPNPQPLVINNTPYDGSEMVVLDIGTEPLIGTTSEITPAQVMEALHIGRSVYLTMYDVPELGMVRFNHFLYSADIDAVFSTAVLKYGDELKSVEIRGQQGGSWVVYTSDIAQKSDMPTALPNPNALTVNGTAYDGSKAVEVATTSLTVAFALTDDGGVTSETDIDAVLWLLSAKRTVTARLTTKGGTYLGAGTFNLVDSAVSTKAIADVMTTEGIYRITAVSTKSDYDVDYLLYTASAGGTVIFEEATVTGDWVTVNKLAFQLDTVYDIYWNGTLYTCTSYESEASVYTGNGHLVNTKLPDTGEPFLFNNGKGAAASMLIKASDQPSSITLMVATHGYKVGGGADIDVVADVGQTIVVEEVDVNGKPTKWRAADYQPKICDYKEVVLLPETELVMVDAEVGMPYAATIDFVIGETYDVIWNGVTYPCEAVDFGAIDPAMPGVIVLGNLPLLMGTGNSGEPFVVMYMGGGGAAMPIDGSATATLSIKGVRATEIPEACVPERFKPFQFDVVYDGNYSTSISVAELEGVIASGRQVTARMTVSLGGLLMDAFFPLVAIGSYLGGVDIQGNPSYGKELAFGGILSGDFMTLTLKPQEDGSYTVTNS